MRDHDKYLKQRGNTYYYQRRVPTEYADFDDRGYIKKSLKTSYIEIARTRRDALVEADNLFWASVVGFANHTATNSVNAEKVLIAQRRYMAAKQRALAKGFIYTTNEELLASNDLTELFKRLDALPENKVAPKHDAEALLGVIPKPHILISQAFELYCNEIAVGDLLGKSPTQAKDWKKIKKRAVTNFISICGDTPMSDITRGQAQNFYNWWADKLKPKGNRKGMSPNSANRDLGNLRLLFTKYWQYEGEENRANPFRNLNFKEDQIHNVLHFEDAWVRDRILNPEIFTSLNKQAILIIYALIETGCRPSEISNILPENIVIDHDIPHIRIRKQGNRQLKTSSSVRDIPLVGVSLIAMRNALEGFPKYHDKGNLLSVSLLKAFRRRSLFPTENHRIYSFRHSFEQRMQEADIDYALRCTLMGHKNNRPKYGDGGSLKYRRDELMKIAHPVPKEFEKRLLAVCKDTSKSNQYTKRPVYNEQRAS